MLAADLPDRFPIPFADAAGPSYIRPIPEASQIGIEDGAASLTDGFPPDTFTPVTAGGTPPFGQDFNGLLYQITSWNRWQSAGGPVTYDAAFQTDIGGYPQGAVIASASTLGLFWLSLVDSNTSNPDTGGANWRGFTPGPGGAYGVAGGTANALTLTTTPATPAYATGMSIDVRASAANTTEGVTIAVSGLPAKSIKLGDNSDPAIGQITPGAVLSLTYDGTNFIWKNAPAVINGAGYAVAGGTVNAITATVTPFQAYAAGQEFRIKATGANTGAMTANLNTKGVKAIVHGDGTAITAGEVQTGTLMLLVYDGTNLIWASAPWFPTPATGNNSQRAATTAFIASAIAASSAFQYTAASSATPFVSFTYNAVNTSAGAVSKPLPASPAVGEFLTFTDIGKIWFTNNFILQRNGNTIMGLAEDLECNVSNLQFSIWWNGSTWVLF